MDVYTVYMLSVSDRTEQLIYCVFNQDMKYTSTLEKKSQICQN